MQLEVDCLTTGNRALIQPMVAKHSAEHIGQRLRRRMQASEIAVETLAEACGVSTQAVYKWFRTGMIARHHLATIKDVLGADLDELVTGNDSSSREDQMRVPPNSVFLNLVRGAKLSAGNGEVIWDFEEIDNSHYFRADWMQKKGYKASRCKLYEVHGDSMWPTLSDGDLVMINMAEREVRTGEVYALVADDGLRIKRLNRLADGTIEMRSDNPQQHKYPPEPIRDENAAVIGRVVWKAGDL